MMMNRVQGPKVLCLSFAKPTNVAKSSSSTNNQHFTQTPYCCLLFFFPHKAQNPREKLGHGTPSLPPSDKGMHRSNGQVNSLASRAVKKANLLTCLLTYLQWVCSPNTLCFNPLCIFVFYIPSFLSIHMTTTTTTDIHSCTFCPGG